MASVNSHHSPSWAADQRKPYCARSGRDGRAGDEQPQGDVSFEQPRRRVEQERGKQVFWLGEIQGALEDTPGGTLPAERVRGDRFEQERLNPPVFGRSSRKRSRRHGRQRDNRRQRGSS
jgi:hypothetical protein